MEDPKKLSLTLLVNKETNRVVLAECDEDFVDVLFSFLALPMGTIIRLLGKQSSLGSMDSLYESVEDLDAKYLQTGACKAMLLQPRSASDLERDGLKLAIDDLNLRRLYRCPKWECFSKDHRLFTTVSGAYCQCGELMNGGLEWTRKAKGDGVFLKAAARFMISENLRVVPLSTQSSIISLFLKHGIRDARSIEKRTVEVGREEILRLVKASLVSKRPLTDAFLPKSDVVDCGEDMEVIDARKVEVIDASKVDVENRPAANTNTARVKLIEYGNKVLYAEAGEDFTNLVLSFLTFPLGSIIKLLNKRSSIGCVDILYKSVEGLCADTDYIKSDVCMAELLSPRLAAYFGCGNRILHIDEKGSNGCRACGCQYCFQSRAVNGMNGKCKHGIEKVSLRKINPKLPDSGTESGGGFVKGSVKFMVTNEMRVSPFSPISCLEMLTKFEAPILSSLVEREIILREAEALKLLKACLTSRTALSYTFCHGKGSGKRKI